MALGVIIGLMVGGGAFAVAQTTKSDDGGVHGGPNPRFHDTKECNLVKTGDLPGNWTHGDYVSAVAKSDPSKVREAAHSRCGKPTHAGKGKGPKDKDAKERDDSDKTPKPKPSPKSSSPTASPSASASASPSPTESASPSPTSSAS